MSERLGKKFAEDFEQIDDVKPTDKILIQDSEDGVVKYAIPQQVNSKFEKLVADIAVAEQSAQTATDKAQDAAHSAEVAEQAKSDAVRAMIDAQTAEEGAQQAVNDAVAGYASEVEMLKQDAEDATQNANTKAQYAKEQGDYAKQQGDYAKAQGNYAKTQGDYAGQQAGAAQSAAANATAAVQQAGQIFQRADNDHQTAVNDHATAVADNTIAARDHRTYGTDHALALSDHQTAVNDHNTATSQQSQFEQAQAQRAQAFATSQASQQEQVDAMLAELQNYDDDLQALREGKMSFCELDCDGSKITRKDETTALTFAEVKALVDDESQFVALRFGDIFWMLPQYDDDGGAIVFTGASLLSEQGWLDRVAINSNNQISTYGIPIENQLLKVDDLAEEAKGNFPTYPTTRAVNEKLTELSQTVGDKMPITDADASIGDENGYEIVRFENGHIKTKNFDSEKEKFSKEEKDKLSGIENGAEVNDVITGDSHIDYSVEDEKHNSILQVENGYVKTKNFDSEYPLIKGVDTPLDGVVFEDENHFAVLSVTDGYPNTKNFSGKKVADASNNYIREAELRKKMIPSELGGYWNSERLLQLSKDINEQNDIMSGFSFAFITDLHFQNNHLNSKYLLKYILDTTSVPYVIAGGDYPAAYGTESDIDLVRDVLLNYINYIGKERFISVRGNHDFTIVNPDNHDEGWHKSLGYVYNSIGRPIEANPTIEINVGNLAWCITNKAHKVKVIGVNSCDKDYNHIEFPYFISREQMEWVVSQIKDGYKYIFVSHVPTSANLTSASEASSQEPLRNLMLAIKNKTDYYTRGFSHSFADTTAEVVCHICGHQHRDASDNTDDILEIVTTCDAYQSEQGGQAFDVFTFDFYNKIIKTKRIGFGEDRMFNF